MNRLIGSSLRSVIGIGLLALAASAHAQSASAASGAGQASAPAAGAAPAASPAAPSAEQLRALAPGGLESVSPDAVRQYATPENLSKLSPEQRAAVEQKLGAGETGDKEGQTEAQKGEKGEKGEEAKKDSGCAAGESCAQTAACPPGQRCAGVSFGPPGLRRFGSELFVNPPSTFAPANFIPVPVDYVLGPGDTVSVQLFGNQNNHFELAVQRDGVIQFPSLGPIQVAGLRFDEMRQLLLDRIGKQMIGTEASITLGTLRSIQIFVVGDVKRPGSYTVSSLSRMLNALFVSGGIADTGSYRRIQLKRGGRVVGQLDLYDLLLHGDSSDDKELAPGDVIFVPPVGRSVAISGAVKRPGIYELAARERVSEVIGFAGGVTADAIPKLTKLERIGSNDRHIMLDADPERSGGNLALENGDSITVNATLDRLDGMVAVKGYANRQQPFQWRPGLHITDLVQSAADLPPLADLNFALLVRYGGRDRHIAVTRFRPGEVFAHPHGPEDLELQPNDELRFFGLDSGRAKQLADLVALLNQQSRASTTSPVVSILGAVQEPGVYPLLQNMRLQDALDAAISTNKDAWLQAALVIRPDLRHNTVQVFEVSLVPADGDLQNFTLAPGDSVRVFGYAQERRPVLNDLIGQLKQQATPEHPAKVISVGGEVRFPGEYPLVEGATAASAISLAGGFREPAFPYDYEITRQDVDASGRFVIKTMQLNPGSQFQSEYPMSSQSPPPVTRRVVESDGKFRIESSGADASAQEEPPQVAATPASQFALQSRDTVSVRRQPGYEETENVTILGEVRFPGTYRARRGEKLSDILKRAGGLSDLANPEGAIFTREELRKAEEVRLREIQADVSREAARLTIVKTTSSTSTSTTNTSPGEQASLLAVLSDRLAEAHGVGRLVINLPKIQAGDPDADVQVADGDVLRVPRVSQEVAVLGEVNYPTAHRFESGESARDYLNRSGGYTQAADTGRVYVIHQNGDVVANAVGWFGSSSVRAGDTIVVPLDLNPILPLPLVTSIASIVGNLAIAAASLKVVGGF